MFHTQHLCDFIQQISYSQYLLGSSSLLPYCLQEFPLLPLSEADISSLCFSLWLSKISPSYCLLFFFFIPLWFTSPSLTHLSSSPNLSHNLGIFNFQHLPWGSSFLSRPMHWDFTFTIWKLPIPSSSVRLSPSRCHLLSCTGAVVFMVIYQAPRKRDWLTRIWKRKIITFCGPTVGYKLVI